MNKYFLFFIVLICFSCRENQNQSFYGLYEQARQENKYLWLNLNFKQDTAVTGLIRRYGDKDKTSGQEYLFRQLNLAHPANAFLNYILLIENTNNSYILNPKGEIISFTNRLMTSDAIKRQWASIRQGKPELPVQSREFISRPDTLLDMQNRVLKAQLLYHKHANDRDSLYCALNLLEEAINIEPYFYNLYLRSKIAETLGMDDAEEYARLATQFCKEGYQKAIYTLLLQELAAKYHVQENKGKGTIEFKATTLSAGKIPLNAKHEFYFEFENTGEEPVIITYVSSTCGCAKPEWSRKPVLPGETGNIKVVFNAEKYGNFIRSVFVQSTAQNNIENLYLRGTVSFDMPPC